MKSMYICSSVVVHDLSHVSFSVCVAALTKTQCYSAVQRAAHTDV
jgi:hypothetical protein